jgi:hypothetical protein
MKAQCPALSHDALQLLTSLLHNAHQHFLGNSTKPNKAITTIIMTPGERKRGGVRKKRRGGFGNHRQHQHQHQQRKIRREKCCVCMKDRVEGGGDEKKMHIEDGRQRRDRKRRRMSEREGGGEGDGGVSPPLSFWRHGLGDIHEMSTQVRIDTVISPPPPPVFFFFSSLFSLGYFLVGSALDVSLYSRRFFVCLFALGKGLSLIVVERRTPSTGCISVSTTGVCVCVCV